MKEYFNIIDKRKKYNACVRISNSIRDQLYILKGVCLRNNKSKTWNTFFENIVIPLLFTEIAKKELVVEH